MEEKYPTYEEDGVKHWAADPHTSDTNRACDMIGHNVEVDCPECLGGIIQSLYKQLEEALHHLDSLNPDGWQCLPNCSHCKKIQSFI